MKLIELDLFAYSIYFNVSKVLERILRPFYFLRVRNIDVSNADHMHRAGMEFLFKSWKHLNARLFKNIVEIIF